jgi:uncharacterized protein YecT (DUF1311 family)
MGDRGARPRLLLLAVLPIVLGSSQSHAWATQYQNAPAAPCRNVVVTAEATQCFYRAYRAVDRKLNKLYAEIKATLPPADRRTLTQTERAWIKHRDTTCERARESWDGGTGQFPEYPACLEAETRKRSSELRTLYHWKNT